MRTWMVVLVLGAGTGIGLAGEVATKQVAAPPSDLASGLLRLPNPQDLGVVSRSALVPVELDANGSWTVDLDPGSRLVLMPAEADAWHATVSRGGSGAVALDRADHIGVPVIRGSGGWLAPARAFEGVAVPEHGQPVSVRVAGQAGAAGYALIGVTTETELYTYPTRLRTVAGEPVALRSELSGGAQIVSVRADVRTPGGDPLRLDALADSPDVVFTPQKAGDYAVRVEVRGIDADGESILLTTQHLVRVEHAAPGFGPARAEIDDGSVVFRFAPGAPGQRSIVAAEVWGERGGVPTPVCWLARVCGEDRSLTLDPRWVAMAGVEPGSLTLREVRAHDVDSMVLVAHEAAVPVEIDAKSVEAVMPGVQPTGITPDMLAGRPGMHTVRVPDQGTPRGALPGGHRLLLVHGYCSGGNPFTTSHFTGDVAVFSDTDQNRSNDAFALQIRSQTSTMKSFGIAGHSQGGMAALHLATFYWSGLDWAQGDRLIQSVGAPYQGTALAGNAAVLGDLFGSGCGSNNDMTYAGAAQWLSTIPTSARQNVWYWTTSFEDRAFQFDYCNIITDLLLSDPDDGVIERSGGQLPGATNMGHREGWCHTSGMRDPAQCTDPSRNSEINTRAKR